MFFVGVPIRFIVEHDGWRLADYVIRLEGIKDFDNRTEKFDKVCKYVLQRAAEDNEQPYAAIKSTWLMYDRLPSEKDKESNNDY